MGVEKTKKELDMSRIKIGDYIIINKGHLTPCAAVTNNEFRRLATYDSYNDAANAVIQEFYETNSPEVDVLDFLTGREFIKAAEMVMRNYGHDLSYYDDLDDFSKEIDCMVHNGQFEFARQKEFEQAEKDYALEYGLDDKSIVEITPELAEYIGLDCEEDDDDDE